MKLASNTHCHIFSYSLCHSAAFHREMIKFLLFPLDILDCHPPSFLKPKVAVACWSNLRRTIFTNVALVFEMRK